MAEFQILQKDVCPFKRKVVGMFPPIYLSRLIRLHFHLLDHRIENVSGFASVSSLAESSCGQVIKIIKCEYCLTPKEYIARINQLVHGLNQIFTNSALETSSNKIFSTIISEETVCSNKKKMIIN